MGTDMRRIVIALIGAAAILLAAYISGVFTLLASLLTPPRVETPSQINIINNVNVGATSQVEANTNKTAVSPSLKETTTPFLLASATKVIPTEKSVLPSTTPTQPTSDLWQFYVDDIKSTVPNAPVTVDDLKNIASNIPSSIPFIANVRIGIIPYQYNWKVLDREGPVSLNAPEGGYAYIAWGFGTITTDRFSISFPAEEDNDHLVLVIGNPEDGTYKDLNTLLRLTEYSPGFAGVNFATPAIRQVNANRNVVNEAWFAQQLWWASKHRSITVTIWDVSNGKRFIYDVNPSNFVWTKK
jgi:hypothetical protein